MNRAIVFIFLLLWISLRLHLLPKAGRWHQCDENLSRLYLTGPAYRFMDGLWNVNGNKTNVSVFERKPFFYFAANSDTIRLPRVYKSQMESLKTIDYSQEFTSLDIYSAQDIVVRFNSEWEPNERFLIYVSEPGMKYVGAAQIIVAQIDFDPEPERIVHVKEEWCDTYMFYESSGNYWFLAGQVSVAGNRDDLPLDFSLDGFVGLPHYAFGTGLSVTDFDYYSFQSGQLRKCFSINKHSWIYMMGLISDPSITLNSESQATQVNADEIFIEHYIVVNKEAVRDTSPRLVFEGTLNYSLVKNSSGIYLPNKTIPGFNVKMCAEECDSTHFYPDVYAFQKLLKLKDNGNAAQKELLRDFVYDSTATFR